MSLPSRDTRCARPRSQTSAAPGCTPVSCRGTARPARAAPRPSWTLRAVAFALGRARAHRGPLKVFRPTVCPAVAAEVPVQKGMCAVARHLAEAGGAAPHLMIPRVWTRHVPAAMSTCDNPSCIDIVRALERTWPARRFQRTRAHALRTQVFKCPKGNYAVCQKVPHPNPRQTTLSPALPGRRHHLGCAATTTRDREARCGPATQGCLAEHEGKKTYCTPAVQKCSPAISKKCAIWIPKSAHAHPPLPRLDGMCPWCIWLPAAHTP